MSNTSPIPQPDGLNYDEENIEDDKAIVKCVSHISVGTQTEFKCEQCEYKAEHNDMLRDHNSSEHLRKFKFYE